MKNLFDMIIFTREFYSLDQGDHRPAEGASRPGKKPRTPQFHIEGVVQVRPVYPAGRAK
ncbi:MAG: hypothetical protein VCG02_03425 [Verrucomicrobiota bacterium]